MTPHTVTKIPPFVLFYNRPVLVLNSTKNPEPVELKEFTPEEYAQMAKEKLKHVNALGDVVQESLVGNGKKMVEKRNKSNKKSKTKEPSKSHWVLTHTLTLITEFDIGDSVAIHHTRFAKNVLNGKTAKLAVGKKRFPFRGEISDINNNGHFIIKLQSGEMLPKPVRAKFLKRIELNNSGNSSDESETSDKSTEENGASTNSTSASNESDASSVDSAPGTIAELKQSYRSRRNNMAVERPDGMSESRFLCLLAEMAANSAK